MFSFLCVSKLMHLSSHPSSLCRSLLCKTCIDVLSTNLSSSASIDLILVICLYINTCFFYVACLSTRVIIQKSLFSTLITVSAFLICPITISRLNKFYYFTFTIITSVSPWFFSSPPISTNLSHHFSQNLYSSEGFFWLHSLSSRCKTILSL